jgi:hypothetical protein
VLVLVLVVVVGGLGVVVVGAPATAPWISVPGGQGLKTYPPRQGTGGAQR